MSLHGQRQTYEGIYILGGAATLIVLMGILLDIIIGSVLGADLSTIPITAIERFAQLHDNRLIGLYNLDMLNDVNQIIMIPTFFALYAAHRKVKKAYAALAMIIFVVGTTIFVANNTALPMLELSNKYAASTTESQKTILAAAGEAVLAVGSHGSPGAFMGFVLPTVANIIMSFVMLAGKIFSKTTSFLGIAGNTFMLIYVVLVTFVPAVKNMAVAFAMPGGLLIMAWMIMLAIRLFQLGRSENN